VLVTGGTGSVGRALVKAFSENGDNVIFVYNHNHDIANLLSSQFGARPLQIDLANDFSVPDPKFEVLINNAGINITDASSHDVTIYDWNLTLRINLSVPFLFTQQCLPFMMEQKKGSIINISSIYGLRAIEGNLPYTVSKHGLAGLTKTVAKEYASFGITCNEICPGPIESELMNRISAREAELNHGAPDDYLKEVSQEIPFGRMAHPEEIANAAMFLASPMASYITGVSLPVDGGMIIT